VFNDLRQGWVYSLSQVWPKTNKHLKVNFDTINYIKNSLFAFKKTQEMLLNIWQKLKCSFTRCLHDCRGCSKSVNHFSTNKLCISGNQSKHLQRKESLITTGDVG
jgi:hypothetical protein